MKDVLRKSFALLLCLCICLSLAPASFAEDEGIELADDEEGILEVEPVIAEEEEDDGACETLLYEEAGFFEETKTPPDSESCAEPLFENESVDLPGEDEDETIWSEFCLEDTEVFSAYNPYPYWQTFYYNDVEYTTITCTYYAWQSVYDNLGIALPAWGNGGDWLVNAQASGYATGSTPRANSLVVWTVPGKWGHVAYVTSADGSSFVYNEGGTANRRANSLGIYEGHPYPDGYTDAPTGFIYLADPTPIGPVLPDGDYIIAAAADTRYYLDIDGSAYPAAGETNVQLWFSADGTVSDIDAWTIKYSNGYYRISQYHQNVSLDVYNESTANEANVQVWYNNDTSAQQWQITGDASSGYRVKARCSGKNLDYQGGVLAQGTNVQQYVEDGTPAQNWMFIPYNPTYYLEVNGVLDGNSAGNVTGYGTFDIYINGTLEGNDVSDYYNSALPAGTTYEIKDIKMVDGKSYTGIKGGTRTGTLNSNTEVLLGFDTIPDSPGVLPSIAIFEGHTYYFYNRPSTWYAAKYMCEKLGGHLVTITSAAEESFIKGMIGSSNLWLGATDKDSEGRWKWVSGETFSYNTWDGQPDNAASPGEGSENYAHIWGSTGKWNDNAGCVTFPFMCEIDRAYTITYNANGGSGAPAAQVKAHGQAIKLSSSVPARNGYTFVGWATSASATSAEYQPGDTYSADADLTLYAIWEPISFTVKNSPYTKGSGQTVSITPITDNSFGGYAYTRTGSYSDAVTISTSNYTIQSGRLSFKSAWLDNLSAGTYYIWGIPALGAPVFLGYMQINAAEMSITVSPTSYTKNDPTAAPVAASGTAIPQMARFGIATASGSYTHVLSNNEYTLSGSTVTLTKDYLNSLADGTYYFIGLTSSNEQIRANSTFTIKSSTPAADAPRFTVSSASARPGETVTLTVAMENNPGIASFELEVLYDAAALSWTGVTKGELPGNWDAAVGEAITWINADNYTEDSAVFTLTFQVLDTAADGDYSVSLRYDADNVFDENGSNVSVAVIPGKVTVSSRTPGDVNGDDKVNNKDVLWLMRFLKGREVTVVPGSTDINGDGKNNNKDVLWLMRYIKYQNVEIH